MIHIKSEVEQVSFTKQQIDRQNSRRNTSRPGPVPISPMRSAAFGSRIFEAPGGIRLGYNFKVRL